MTENNRENRALRILKKIGNNTLLALGALVVPIGLTLKRNAKGKRRLRFDLHPVRALKRLAIFTATYFVLQPLSLFLFPTARDTLQKKGIDPDVTGKNLTEVPVDNIRVVPDNIAGKTFVLFSAPPIINPVGFYENVQLVFDGGCRAFQTYDVGALPRLVNPLTNYVYLKDNKAYQDTYNKEMTALTEEISSGLFTYSPTLSGDEYALKVLLHEIRHSSLENIKLSPLFREADSDFAATTEMIRLSGDTTLARRMVDEKALASQGSLDHDNVIYLYCKFNKQAVPSEADIRAANMEAQPAIATGMDLCLRLIMGDSKLDSLTQVFNTQVKQLSPLAKLRVALFMEAQQKHTVLNTQKFQNLLGL